MAFLLVIAACGGDDDDAASEEVADGSVALPTAIEEPADEPTDEPATDVPDSSEDDSAEVDSGAGESGGGADATVAASAWIESSSGLDPAIRASLVLAGTERAGNVTHVRFAQTYEALEVESSELIVHVLSDGTVQGATSALSTAPAPPPSEVAIDEENAVAIALKAIEGTASGEPVITSVWVENSGTLQLTWRIDVATTEPLGAWSVFVDTATGAVLRAESDESRRSASAVSLAVGSVGTGRAKSSAFQDGDRCELPAAPSACVFVPDPIFAAGGVLNDASDANDFLTGVALQGLDDPASGALVGEYANVEPGGAPVDPTRQPDGLWGAGRGDPGFEAQNVYYWIDYGQRTIQRLGFDSILNESFPVIPVDPQTVDNAFYSPRDGLIFLGVGSNGIHEGEDASGILHEYGHAVLDDINPGLLSTGDVGAYHEGFGDIFAALVTIEYRTGDWPCFFMWTDQACIRRMDTSKVYPDDLVRAIHDDGEIYSAAIADILAALLSQEGIDINTCPGTDQCGEVRDRVLTTVLASNYYLTANMTMPDIAASYIEANEAQFGGADADLIEAAFAARGLSGGTGTLIDADGTTNGAAPALVVEVDIAHSYRGDLNVTVGVVDPDFNELCTPVVLFEPDPDDDERDLSGEVDLSDTDCALVGPPAADRIWFLLVEDTLADDEGEIVGFRVLSDGAPYLAPGLPLPIADADPDGSVALVDGSGQDVDPAGTEAMGASDGTGPFVSASLTHDYHGDLQVRTGVASADGTIVCSVPVLEPDPADDESGELSGDIDMSECAALFPPSPDEQWFLQVIDTAAADTGVIEAFSLTGPSGEQFVFGDVPVDVPDDDVDGIALLLDGSGGSSGQAGGSGQNADIALPSASITIRHPFAGDLAVTGGVADLEGNLLCEVVLSAPNPDNDGIDLIDTVSLADCERFYPPAPDRQWYLFVADTLNEDVGTVEKFSLTGPDGARYTFDGGPRDLPDADPDGIVLLLDGSELGVGATDEPIVSLVIEHPYIGDLDIVVGVATAAEDVLCGEIVTELDGENDAVDLAVDIPLGVCTDFYPPGPDQQWFVAAIDHLEFDEGTIEAFALFGPDGQAWIHPAGGIDIPDEDPDGIALLFDGSQDPIGSS